MDNPLTQPVQNDSVNPLRQQQLRRLKIAGPTVVAVFIMALCCLVLGSLSAVDSSSPEVESGNTSVLTPITTPIVTPTATATAVARLVTVEYQLDVSSSNQSVPIQFWFTSDPEGESKAGSQTIRTGQPFTVTVQMNRGDYVEVAGVIANGGKGEIACRIFVEGILIEQSTGKGSGAGVFCSGTVTAP
jgi:hypothetical protein